MEDKSKTYMFGGVTYVQRTLVLGQIRQLQGVLEGVRLSKESGNAALIAALGDNISAALAVVLTPEGSKIKDKDLVALGAEIEFAITPEQIFEVIDDFFTCNPMRSLLDRFKGMAAGIKGKIEAIPGLKKPSASSPEETLQKGKQSSGESLQKNADHT